MKTASFCSDFLRPWLAVALVSGASLGPLSAVDLTIDSSSSNLVAWGSSDYSVLNLPNSPFTESVTKDNIAADARTTTSATYVTNGGTHTFDFLGDLDLGADALNASATSTSGLVFTSGEAFRYEIAGTFGGVAPGANGSLTVLIEDRNTSPFTQPFSHWIQGGSPFYMILQNGMAPYRLPDDSLYRRADGSVTGVLGAGTYRFVVNSSLVQPGEVSGEGGADSAVQLVIGPVIVDDPPTANAGEDQSIHAGDPVFLDGSASFDDNTTSENLQYAWTFTEVPGGSTAALVDADTAIPSFVADLTGSYTVSLVVTDEGGLPSVADEVEISSNNLAPSADAGENTIAILGEAVLLSGSGSDPDDDAVSLLWTITSAPAGSTAALVDANTATPSLSPDLVGLYEIELVASDFLGAGAPDGVEVTVITAEEFAAQEIVDSVGTVENLVPGQVTTGGNQNALTNFLGQALLAIEEGDLTKAIDKLEKAISRTDGCALRGSPDGNGPGRDWITDCAAQASVYSSLTGARDTLVE